MNLIIRIILKFFGEEKIDTLMLLVTSILVSLIQTSGISSITANIINTVKERDQSKIYNLLRYFVFVSIVYLIIFYLYRYYQNNILTKLLQWIRNELAYLLVKSNNEDFTDKNFFKFNAPINRISSVCFMFISDLFTFIIPNFAFFIVICSYFMYYDLWMGLAFLTVNLLICIYVYLILPTIIEKNDHYEKQFSENEAYFLEMLNNMDKIVYRGQSDYELAEYKKLIDKTISSSYDFYSYMNNQGTILNVYVYSIIFAFLYYTTGQVLKKKINVVLYITFITIIILYRDRMATIIQQITEFVEFSGRANGVLANFKDVNYDFETIYKPVKLTFDKITFENVSFKYKTKETYAFQNFNLELLTNKKIIGITGVSGRGKSTFIKLILKMYKSYEGNIYIDNVNIRGIDPDYIRKNIIYVNQNSKLFDRLIIDNMMYGCTQTEKCKENLDKVMNTFPKIRELFKDNDIYSTRVGSLGEKMSGGQRMIISIITGLISPSVGLILDEPTTGLDVSLKNEVLQLISKMREYKKFIIIITHDKDVYKIMDQKLEI